MTLKKKIVVEKKNLTNWGVSNFGNHSMLKEVEEETMFPFKSLNISSKTKQENRIYIRRTKHIKVSCIFFFRKISSSIYILFHILESVD